MVQGQIFLNLLRKAIVKIADESLIIKHSLYQSFPGGFLLMKLPRSKTSVTIVA